MNEICHKSEQSLAELQQFMKMRMALLKETRANFAFISSKIKTIELYEQQRK
jgi:hypothetical protein